MLSVSPGGITRRFMALSHLVTCQLGARAPKKFPFIFVLGFPKSGTTWACQLVASYHQLPFPRFSLLPVTFPAVVHGHEAVDKKYPYCVYVMRDGRDAMTSLYYHIQRAIVQGRKVGIPRKYHSIFLTGDDYASVRRNFPKFLELQIRRPLGSHHSWSEHVLSALDCSHPRLAMLRYEDLLNRDSHVFASQMSILNDKQPQFERAQFIIDDFSFSRLSGRKQESEDKSKFLRKGIAGDWKNHFTREAAEVFNHHCGTALFAAGYESDPNWVEAIPKS